MGRIGDPSDSDVPYFPFSLLRSDENGDFETMNHLLDRPVSLNRQAAEVLRLADGETPLGSIVSKIASHYETSGGTDVVRPRIVDFLRSLSQRELIWWREMPIVSLPTAPPPSIFWEITAACNLRCRHCVVGAGEKRSRELSTERCLTLAEELAAFGVGNVAFSGGEPLLHPEFFQIAQRVRELGLSIQVATNGTLVTSEVARLLKALDAEVQVSLDGSKPEIHDYMRPGHKAFEKAIGGIEALVAAGHEVMIGTVLSTINKEDLLNIISLAESLGAVHFRLIPFVPKGRGEKHANMEVSPAEVKDITQTLLDIRGKVRINITNLEFEEILTGKACIEPLNLSQKLGCGGATSYGTITPTGELLPCHFFSGVRADNVVSVPFAEVWKRSRFLNYLRQLTVADLHGGCRKCIWLPSCGGSCRAVNFAKGDLFGTNPQCWITQELGGD